MKIGIVLATRADFPTAFAIARAARNARHEVTMFAMDAGVHALAANPSDALAMIDDDCELIACSNSAVGIDLPEGIERGSQDDHAAVLGTSDRVVALT